MKSRMTKKQKVEITISSLFGELPDEMVLTILSYGEMNDIQNTRIWQSKKVKASENNNLDNLKWIYECIGDTNFTKSLDKMDGQVVNCSGIHE